MRYIAHISVIKKQNNCNFDFSKSIKKLNSLYCISAYQTDTITSAVVASKADLETLKNITEIGQRVDIRRICYHFNYSELE
jgi:hypothetical protein